MTSFGRWHRTGWTRFTEARRRSSRSLHSNRAGAAAFRILLGRSACIAGRARGTEGRAYVLGDGDVGYTVKHVYAYSCKININRMKLTSHLMLPEN